jgi:toxin ParE1/3/4
LDLEEIYDWIADGADPATADAYVQRLQDACARLSEFPARGSPREELDQGLRSISLSGRATAYYRVEQRTVRIVRILRPGRDPAREFRPN